MTTLLSEAQELEREGELEEAGEKFFLFGSTRIISGGADNTPDFRKGIAYCIRSVRLYVQSEQQETAAILSAMTEPLLYRLICYSESEVEMGLGWEWLGDLYLIVGDSNKDKFYQKAMDTFENVSMDERLHWGARPEHETMFLNIKKYAGDDRLPTDLDYTLDFVDRCAWKIHGF